MDVLAEMLLDRKHTSVQPTHQGVDPVLVLLSRDPTGNPCGCWLTNERKVGVKTVRKMRADASNLTLAHVFLVTPEGLTPFARKELRAEDAPRVEVFTKAQLAFNVTRHWLVPTHTALTPTQKKKLLGGLGCKTSALPKLKDSDPVAHYFGWPPGTVVRINRRIGTMEPETYYRVVIAA